MVCVQEIFKRGLDLLDDSVTQHLILECVWALFIVLFLHIESTRLGLSYVIFLYNKTN